MPFYACTVKLSPLRYVVQKKLRAIHHTWTLPTYLASKPALLAGSYQVESTNQAVTMHPSSVLRGKSPSHVVFNEIIWTTKQYMMTVATIEPQWLRQTATWTRCRVYDWQLLCCVSGSENNYSLVTEPSLSPCPRHFLAFVCQHSSNADPKYRLWPFGWTATCFVLQACRTKPV